MVVSLYFGGKSHVSNGQNVSLKEPCQVKHLPHGPTKTAGPPRQVLVGPHAAALADLQRHGAAHHVPGGQVLTRQSPVDTDNLPIYIQIHPGTSIVA